MKLEFEVARVLVVDDHRELAENVVEILGEAITELHLECTITRTSEDALAAAADVRFDLALLDLHLPDGHGLSLLRRLREQWPLLQVVFITGDATVESAIRALEEGAFGYVLKPFQAPQLVETARKAIERSKLLREREHLRAELERSERRNREVIDNVPAFVVALDERNHIAVWNRQLELVTGYGRDEMLGENGAPLVTPDTISRLSLKGGGHRSVRWRLATMTQASGAPPMTYALGVDVTDESEMQRRAMRAERLAAVGTLAAGLAHEVRNPLNSATLQLQLLDRKLTKGQLDAASAREVVAVVKLELERLDHLVSDFLAFAKPKPLVLSPSDLNALIESVAQLCTVEAERMGVAVRLELSPGLGDVPMETASMRQVLLNLIRNALEAMRPTGGSLLLRTRLVAAEAAVAIDVVDSGPGFPEDAPIFDAFYTTKDTGTGLGLAIVHRIISEHGGNITVRTHPGNTCFSLQLPQPAAPSRLPTESQV